MPSTVRSLWIATSVYDSQAQQTHSGRANPDPADRIVHFRLFRVSRVFRSTRWCSRLGSSTDSTILSDTYRGNSNTIPSRVLAALSVRALTGAASRTPASPTPSSAEVRTPCPTGGL